MAYCDRCVENEKEIARLKKLLHTAYDYLPLSMSRKGLYSGELYTEFLREVEAIIYVSDDE